MQSQVRVVKWLAIKSDVGASDKQGASVVRLGKNGESRSKDPNVKKRRKTELVEIPKFAGIVAEWLSLATFAFGFCPKGLRDR